MVIILIVITRFVAILSGSSQRGWSSHSTGKYGGPQYLRAIPLSVLTLRST